MKGISALSLAGTLLTFVATAAAGGPRYVTGPPFFTGKQGVAIGWKQPSLLYSTDPGILGSAVDHTASDALVAAAAGVWNVSVASITLGQGQPLAEHVSGANTYLDSSGMVFPADVMAGNFAAVPLAVIYDTDGSVTDTLLGGGASDPSGCQQNAVTESVDRFDPAGYILHAILILNGRCTGVAPEQQLQMQYQLERAFGRVLGLAWSQTNDNVFTGQPQPTYGQALHWPILHPVDILCGGYSYQCLPQPFVLRPDDIAAMVAVYPINNGQTPGAGKQLSLAEAHKTVGHVTFPSGEGMEGVNVQIRREPTYTTTQEEGWYEVSAITGLSFRRNDAPPFQALDTGPLGSMGAAGSNLAGYYVAPFVPLLGPYHSSTDFTSIEPVNPLYTRGYSVGPYAAGVVSPAGSPPRRVMTLQTSPNQTNTVDFPIPDAPVTCGDGLDGTFAVPAQLATAGWWNGVLCGYGHVSYVQAAIQPGHSFTVEVTALDQLGFATTAKAMPVMGLYAGSDAAGATPSYGATAAAFQSTCLGMSALAVTLPANVQGGIKLAIADQRNDGRPDFAYQARLFYADHVSASQLPSAGGTITLTGTGFRTGNAVFVNGVEVTVVSWTGNSIVLTAPAMSAAGATAGVPVDLAVSDRGTGATSTISGGLTYTAGNSAPGSMKLVSAPSGTASLGAVDPTAFSVQLLAVDGVSAVSNAPVLFQAAPGTNPTAIRFSACAAAQCTVTTDASGLASTSVTPLQGGLLSIQAGSGALLQTASFNAQASPTSMTVLAAPPPSVVLEAKTLLNFMVRVFAADGTTGVPGQIVTFTSPAGTVDFAGCNASSCSVTVDNYGIALVRLTATAAGPVRLLANDGALSQQVTFNVVSQPDTLVLVQAPSATAFVNESAGVFSVKLVKADGVTLDNYQPLALMAPPGIVFSSCSSNGCTLKTDSQGYAETHLASSQTGTFVVQATYGNQVVSATTTITRRAMQLVILSKPADDSLLRVVAPSPFTGQLLDMFGRPLGGMEVVLAAPAGSVDMGCNRGASCLLITDGNGTVSANVTPLVPGAIPLTFVYLGFTQSASFTAVGTVESFRLLVAPPADVYVGDKVTFSVQLIGPDGVTPVPGRFTSIIVSGGVLAIDGCFSGVCRYYTDAQGKVTITAAAYVVEDLTLHASINDLLQTASFSVHAHLYSMHVVSTPASGSAPLYPNTASPVAFAVQVVNSDGITPVRGQNVTFQIPGGNARIAGCTTVPCVVATDANGIASTGPVTALSPGNISILATDNTLSASTTFAAIAKPDLLQRVSAPSGSQPVGVSIPTSFTVAVLQGDGITPDADKPVVFSVPVGSVHSTECPVFPCTLRSALDGRAKFTLTPISAGEIDLLAAIPSASVTAQINGVIRPDVLQLITAPVNFSIVGVPAAMPFSMHLLNADGITPVALAAINLSVPSGLASFPACGAAPTCILFTDAGGLLSAAVKPLAAGSIVLRAVEATSAAPATAAASLTTTFSASIAPQVLSIQSSPQSVFQDGTTVQPLILFVTQVDGITPAARVPLSLTASGTGSIQFQACASPACTLTTDAAGHASTVLMGITPGNVLLGVVAHLPFGDQVASAPFLIRPNVLAVDGYEPQTWIAEGAAIVLKLELLATINGLPPVPQPILWNSTAGFALAQANTVTDTAGSGRVQAVLGPLAINTTASASACVWTTFCVTFRGDVVAATDWRLLLVSGASQAITGAAAFNPVILRVVDLSGHPVAGAPVSIGQVVYGQTPPCPSNGRCPAAPTLATQQTVEVSDLDGLIQVLPLNAPGITFETHLLFSSGTQAAATVVVAGTP